jgi:hypothetical protein
VRLAIFNASLVIAAASPPVIGVARSRTAMIVNHASVPGVATILEGTSVETTDTPSNVNLTNGERLVLAPASSARIQQDRLILDRGGAELTGSRVYRLETTDFRIGASTLASHVQITTQGAGHVHVEAVGGAAEVRNAQGLLIAKVQANTALQLQPTKTSTTQLEGVVRNQEGKFFLTDELTRVGVELRGGNLASFVGRRVGIVGSPLADAPALADASQVISVSQAALAFDDGDPGGPSADAPYPDPSPDPSSGPPPHGHKKKKAALIIIGGAVVTGGTLGGLWAAGVIGGTSSLSR